MAIPVPEPEAPAPVAPLRATPETNTAPASETPDSTAAQNGIPPMPEKKVSALSLASIRAKRELMENQKLYAREEQEFINQAFTETDMLLQWNKYAQRLGDKGQKIMETYLLINDPKMHENGVTIIHELPNEGSKLDFDTEKHGLLGYLRGKLHNHDITIEVVVNETVETKFAFTPQDKFNRLNEINPALEMLRKTFDLDF